MSFRQRLLRPSNNHIRIAVGLLLAGLFCIQCTRSEAFKATPIVSAYAADSEPPAAGMADPRLQQLDNLAKKDHVALIKQAIARYKESVQDYSCTFIKQERLNGQLQPDQEIKVKFREQPFSVGMQWVRNAPIGDAILYVEGKCDGQMLVRPKGLLGKMIGVQMRKPGDPAVMANTLKPITAFGLRKNLESLLAVYELAGQRGDSVNSFAGYKEVAGRKVMVLKRELPNKPDYPCKLVVWYLDVEYEAPMALESYDWDDQLIASYLYKGLKFNNGYSDSDFAPEANGLQLRK